jgi:hypothetical protein
VNGNPARLVPVHTHDRVRLIEGQNDWDVEFVASDLPAFGYKSFTLRPSEEHTETIDEGRTIAAGDVSVVAHDDGTLDVSFGDRTYTGILGLEDVGDRGDTYDFDPVPGDWKVGDVQIARTKHPSGIQTLRVKRFFGVPMLTEDRNARSNRNRYLELSYEARVAPGIDRVDVHVVVRNEAVDHRLRLLFPTGAPVASFLAATTLDVATRSTEPRDGSKWLHPAPATFPQQGWISANDLTVVAPGLVEAEVTPDGVIAITLLRSVGWLSRMDLRTRPSHAGPGLPTPGAQCHGKTEARLALLRRPDARAARDAELRLRAAVAGDEPLYDEGVPLVTLEPRELLLSALKPAERGNGFILRILNPRDDEHEAVARFGFDVGTTRAVRLDEERAENTVSMNGREVRFTVPPHALRSIYCERT